MANPTEFFVGSIDGVWLMAFQGNVFMANQEAWIGSDSPPSRAEREGELFASPSRREKISQSGVVHLDEGTITGVLLDRFGVTGDQWLIRLQNLIRQQHDYDVYLSSPRYYFKVELGTLDKTPKVIGGRGWEVSVDFRELA